MKTKWLYTPRKVSLFKWRFFLNKLFWSTTVFDVRFLGGLQLALLLPAIYLLVAGLTAKMKGWPGYVVAALTVFIFADTAYTAYFNSFFSEGLILIMMLYISAGFLLLYQHKYNDYAMLGLIFVASLILITAKQQNAPIAVVLRFVEYSCFSSGKIVHFGFQPRLPF